MVHQGQGADAHLLRQLRPTYRRARAGALQHAPTLALLCAAVTGICSHVWSPASVVCLLVLRVTLHGYNSRL